MLTSNGTYEYVGAWTFLAAFYYGFLKVFFVSKIAGGWWVHGRKCWGENYQRVLVVRNLSIRDHANSVNICVFATFETWRNTSRNQTATNQSSVVCRNEASRVVQDDIRWYKITHQNNHITPSIKQIVILKAVLVSYLPGKDNFVVGCHPFVVANFNNNRPLCPW